MSNYPQAARAATHSPLCHMMLILLAKRRYSPHVLHILVIREAQTRLICNVGWIVIDIGVSIRVAEQIRCVRVIGLTCV